MNLPHALRPLAIAAWIATGGAELAAEPPGTAGDGAPSPNFAYYTFAERTGRVTLLVDSNLAMNRRDEPYVPLQIAAGLFPAPDENGERRPGAIEVRLDDLELTDAAGSSAAPVAYREIRARYGKLDADRAFIREHPINTGELFTTSHRVAADFYPSGIRPNMRTDRVELAAYGWFRDVVYFRRPEGGLDGVLALRLRVEGEDEPIEVRFRVPTGRSGTGRASN